mmetsp:Transcript_6202/g.14520  ORF Transcript_6202/g.14520 Transcript_6202/m.14520 type:complete len:276 (-) Transcript_6202:715-1542(-)
MLRPFVVLRAVTLSSASSHQRAIDVELTNQRAAREFREDGAWSLVVVVEAQPEKAIESGIVIVRCRLLLLDLLLRLRLPQFLHRSLRRLLPLLPRPPGRQRRRLHLFLRVGVSVGCLALVLLLLGGLLPPGEGPLRGAAAEAPVPPLDGDEELPAPGRSVLTHTEPEPVRRLRPIPYLTATDAAAALTTGFQDFKDGLPQIREGVPRHNGHLWNVANDAIQADPGVHLRLDPCQQLGQQPWILLGIRHKFAFFVPGLDPREGCYFAGVDLPVVGL